jgi:hypothetical protein
VDIDLVVNQTATPYDLMVVEFVGLTAAAVAAAQPPAVVGTLWLAYGIGGSQATDWCYHCVPGSAAHPWPIRARA